DEDAPVAVNDSYTVLENGTLSAAGPVGLLVNDTHEGSPVLHVVSQPTKGSFTAGPNNNGAFTYEPFANENGTDTFTYYLRENGLNSGLATVTINITAVDTPPVATPDVYVI